MAIQAKRASKQSESDDSQVGELAMISAEQLNEAVEKESEKIVEHIEKTEQVLEQYIAAPTPEAKSALRKQFVDDYKELNHVYNHAVNALNILQKQETKAGYFQNPRTLAELKKGTKFTLMDLKAFYHSAAVLKSTKLIKTYLRRVDLYLVFKDTYQTYEDNGDWKKVLVDGLAGFAGAEIGGAIAGGIVTVLFMGEAPFILAAAAGVAGAIFVSNYTEQIADNILEKYKQ